MVALPFGSNCPKNFCARKLFLAIAGGWIYFTVTGIRRGF
jgi:hypothetical protein